MGRSPGPNEEDVEVEEGGGALITLMGLTSPPRVRSGLVMARCASPSGHRLSAPPSSGQIASKTITWRWGPVSSRQTYICQCIQSC